MQSASMSGRAIWVCLYAQYDESTVADRHQAMEIAVDASSLRGGTCFREWVVVARQRAEIEAGDFEHGSASPG